MHKIISVITGQCTKLENTRFWGHYSQKRAENSTQCENYCFSDDVCNKATWEAGNTSYNCWLFNETNRTTQEEEYISFDCGRVILVREKENSFIKI